ncbi:hypothetical protein PF005_g5494 [Phytophthora fragariae]|uniref:Uncharacterized protein n=1 Tax=Phytophthora fragariae TaxID=53985 RepID=A0A6A3T142_9STRA|nr:hypothetical protein PF009_g6019 [Phytophthora fragariae]KAE9127640.1 hypothetical protein PF007_g5561 [Phytophthora fragariae]KAE9225531.1 hypothetical protein PF005_g5494 [Phytophthora fragariae]KAE9246869.1 hypothetical protein PF004_g4613 [Phytophthora fragariae]KAE9321719.1 hypothetical protein PF001_g4775 [Phytophthora fragariae]
MAPSPASRRRRSAPLLLLSLTLSLLLSASSAAVSAEAARPHCADFLSHCAWNDSTSSCEFRESISFVCGPRSASEPPLADATGSGSLLDAATVSATSFGGDSDAEVGVSAVAGFTCHWDVAGGLYVAPGVDVAVEGDDCLLHVGSGQMVLLGAKASLRASSLSVEASFVHLEAQAQISASYSGSFRDGRGLFTGTDVFGASHGGGGGQRLIANATMLTQQTTRGFFDVRGRTVDVQLIEEKEALLKESSAGWQLADLWAKEKALMADPAVMTASSGASGGPSATIAPFLLGSGSRVVIAGNDSSEHVVTVDGGGRIQIKASKDVVVMDGATIQANGGSAIEGVSGGSGGSVYISANALSLSGKVEAKGGDAFCTDNAADRGVTHCYPAGGGGRVQITFMSSQLDTDAIDTTGGTLNSDQVEELLAKNNRFRHVQVSALAGAAGTYYQVVQHSDGVHEAQLLVDNDMQRLWPNRVLNDDGDALDIDEMDAVIGGAVTSLYVGDDEAANIDALTISDGAVVATGSLKLPGGDLRVLNGSFLLDALLVGLPHQLPDSISVHSSSKPPVLQIRVRDMLVSSSSQMILPTSALQLSARSVSMDATAALEFTWSAQIITSQNIHIDANVSSALNPIIAAPALSTATSSSTPVTTTKIVDSKMLALVSGGDVFLGGVIGVGALSVSSEFSITIDGHLESLNGPNIKSTFRSCKDQQWLSLGSLKENLGKEDHHDGSAEGAPIPNIPSALPALSNFTLVLHARGSIYVGQSNEAKKQIEDQLEENEELPPQPIGRVRGGAVLLCATDSVEISPGSIVSADGMGELANQGPGMGSCAGSIGGGAGNRKEPSYTRMYNSRGAKGERQHLLSSAVANSQRSWFASLFRCFYWPRVGYPKLMERDLPEHMARLYFAGYNDPDSPLKLRTTVPPSLKKVLYDVEFKNLADRINRVLAWQRGPCSSWGKIVYFLVALLCYPFASEVKLFRRHIRVNELKRIVAKYNHACMKGPRARGLLNAVKLGYCADYSLVYLELLYKESSQSVCVPTTKIGKPSLPLVLLFAGCGTYFSPFYLDPNDLLVRSIPQCPELTAFIDEPWIEFVAELNELLRVVQRDEASLVESLIPVAVYLEKQRALAALGNNSSKLGGLRIYLGRFYVQDELGMGEEFKLGVFLTTADESMDNVSSSNNNIQQTHQQAPPSSNRYGYGSHHSKDTNYYNINDVYGYGRGDSLDYPGPRRSNGSFGNADGLIYDMGGWGTALTNSNLSRGRSRSSNGPGSGNGAAQNPVGSIREEALRIRSSSSHGDGLAGHSGRGGNPDDVLVLMGSGSSKKKRHNSAAHHTFYEGWLGPVDASLPVPGVLICADELRERLADRAPRQMLKSFLRFHLLPRNLPRSSSLNLSWMLSISLLTFLMVDLAITFAILVNLKCVTNGEVDHDCSASIMVPVLLVPPLALVVSPIMGIVSLALSSSTFTRRFSVWNALSMISVGIAILACIAQSSRLVAPWFAGPLPLLPVIAMGVKAGQAYVVERYIAFQETKRRRRGWRGIMKRRLSDASIPTESPYSSPAPGRAEFRLTSTPPTRDDQSFNIYGGYN